MSLYEQFSDEALFRQNFVRPLLNKLGFFLVADYHGQREFGKDFVFSELHRFGGIRHYAAQVKHMRTIGLGKTVDELVTDMNQAFANPFTLPDSPTEAYISSFYVFNSGRITNEAKDDLIQRIRRTSYAGNVYFLDGDRLDSLNKWATFQNDQNLRSRLSGLRNQLIINIIIWNSVIKDTERERFGEARGPILAGIEAFLSSPISPERISENDLMQLWQRAHIIHSISTRYLLGVRVTEEIKKKDIETRENSPKRLSSMLMKSFPMLTTCYFRIETAYDAEIDLVHHRRGGHQRSMLYSPIKDTL